MPYLTVFEQVRGKVCKPRSGLRPLSSICMVTEQADIQKHHSSDTITAAPPGQYQHRFPGTYGYGILIFLFRVRVSPSFDHV
jgi:hypothetical protein